MKNLLLLFSCWTISHAVAAQKITGTVTDASTKEPIIGASVFWLNYPAKGVSADIDGRFILEKFPQAHQLVVTAVGYTADTLMVYTNEPLSIRLEQSNENLNEVVVKGQSTVLDRLSPIQTEIITTKTLAKAACCNLSESFETNATVSVSYADAVTGAKQIRMLGLSGNYVQTNTENLPSVRGLASTFGLNYIPGTWIQSIDVAKGVGSVVTGYEAMSGGINVELMKPDNSERLYVNTYVNSLGRGEVNVNAAHKLNEKWSVGLLTHGSALQRNIDKNGDGFLDAAKYNQVNLLNRWKYAGERFMGQFGVRYLHENRLGGQTGFTDLAKTPNLYGFTNRTNRTEFFSKMARLYPDKPYRGLALITDAVYHTSASQFGRTPYDATQRNLYSNVIYQDILGDTRHTYRTGVSFMYDDYDENYGAIQLQRTEVVPGAYFEYTYNNLDKTVLVLGGRADFHNLYGTQFSPRMHFKQDISDKWIWRLAAGSGFRVPNRLVEYYGNLVSSRQVVFLNDLNTEKSWNYGTSLTRFFGKSSLILDFYRTDFQRKLIADVEHPGYLYFYFSDEKAYANAFQAEFNFVPNDRWEAKLAYRYLDTKQTMGKPYNESVLIPVMFQSPSRWLANVGYALPYDKWKADLTVNWNSQSRIPNTAPGYDHTSYATMPTDLSPSYFNVNAQVTRTFVNWEVYLGGENLGNFRQLNPIIEPENPFGNRFDAGMNWGPVIGRVIYLGTRYRIR